MNIKKLLKYLIAYYLIGLVVMNILMMITGIYLGFPPEKEITTERIVFNMSNPYFYGSTLVWPVYSGIIIYDLLTGSVSESTKPVNY